jgi:hypothetical protein
MIESPHLSGRDRAFGGPSVKILLFVFAAGFFIYASIRVVRHQAMHPTDGDWGVYYRTGLAMLHRQPIYTLDHGPLLTFKNAPAVALLLVPMSLVPMGLARWLWLVGDLACLVIMYRLAGRVVFGPQTSRRVGLALIAGAIFLSAHYITDELFSGPTAMLVVMLTVAGFVWAYEGRGVRAGFALGLGIVLKLVPLAFVPWLLCCKSRWSSLSSLVITLALLTVLPATWVEWSRNLQLLRDWPAHIAHTEIPVQNYRTKNQSVNAALTRFLTDTPYGVNVANVNKHSIQWLNLLVMVTAAIAIYSAIVRSIRRGRDDPAAALSLLLIYMTVCNPLAWRYNYVALGIPYLYVLHALWSGIHRPRLVIGLVAVSYLLHFAPEFMQALSARLWGALALTIAVALCWKGGTGASPVQADYSSILHGRGARATKESAR